MTRHYERRTSQAQFYDAIHDRRRVDWDRRKQEAVPAKQEAVPAKPGAIRPGVGETVPRRERRQAPESGTE